MNFLDAHKMVHDISGAFAKDVVHKDDFFRPLSLIPFDFDKDKIVTAFQIYFAHMVLYQTRTPEQYEQYQVMYMNLNMFLPDEEVIRIRKDTQWALRKGIFYNTFFKDKIAKAKDAYGDDISLWTDSGHYRMDDISNHTAKMQEYRREIVVPMTKNKEIDMDYIIELYVQKAYELAEVEYIDDYFYFFHPFDLMRKHLNVPNFRGYYVGYEDYIRTNQ